MSRRLVLIPEAQFKQMAEKIDRDSKDDKNTAQVDKIESEGQNTNETREKDRDNSELSDTFRQNEVERDKKRRLSDVYTTSEEDETDSEDGEQNGDEPNDINIMSRMAFAPPGEQRRKSVTKRKDGAAATLVKRRWRCY